MPNRVVGMGLQYNTTRVQDIRQGYPISSRVFINDRMRHGQSQYRGKMHILVHRAMF